MLELHLAPRKPRVTTRSAHDQVIYGGELGSFPGRRPIQKLSEEVWPQSTPIVHVAPRHENSLILTARFVAQSMSFLSARTERHVYWSPCLAPVGTTVVRRISQ